VADVVLGKVIGLIPGGDIISDAKDFLESGIESLKKATLANRY